MAQKPAFINSEQLCNIKIIMRDTTATTSRTQAAEATWSRLLTEMLQRGFYGTLAVEVTVQDGTIQKISERMERVNK
ncbi:MAG: hypothetical protein KDA63_02910 [Planctomycetales bacterium]|nr:hypothetical protein [Planctomycetales bacterium]